MYRRRDGALEVLLVHPGGPFWARKDAGAWSIPKGEIDPTEEPLAAARREFTEETGFLAEGNFRPLAPITQAGGKIVQAWAFEGDADPAALQSNTFAIEWPPRSGRQTSFPEADRAAWFSLDVAREKINPAQVALLDELAASA
jgi:predicted NUDIX family NTP pyrophosphohydrolase